MRKAGWAAVIAAAVMVAGCSSKGAPPEQSSTPSPTSGHGAYANCLHEHGVSAPPVAEPPPGTDENTWHKATQACASLAPGPDTG
jgi:hypothetical protein